MLKTILITGGAGFIGSNLIDALIARNIKVVCLDSFDGFYARDIKQDNIASASRSPLFTLIEGDIRDKSLLENVFREHNIDTVIHLAAKVGVRPSILDPQQYLDVNVNGTLGILEAMKSNAIKKLVFTSSSSVYGDNAHIPCAESDHVDQPISPYAASKKSAELLTHTYHHLYDFNVINLRLFTVYGPRQRPDLAIHRFFKSIYSGEPIDVYGDGDTARDYTYVDDIVSGISRALSYLGNHEKVYEVINLGNSSPVKLSDLIGLIEDITRMKFFINRLPQQQGDVGLTFADINKARKLIGYDPGTTLAQGLTQFKKWFETREKRSSLPVL